MKVQNMAQDVTDNLTYWEWYMALKNAKKEIKLEYSPPKNRRNEVEYGTRKERQE